MSFSFVGCAVRPGGRFGVILHLKLLEYTGIHLLRLASTTTSRLDRISIHSSKVGALLGFGFTLVISDGIVEDQQLV